MTRGLEAIKEFVSPLYTRIGQRYCRKRCEWAFEKQRFVQINERPIEYAFVFGAITQTWPRSVLDVGTGKTAVPALIRACGPVVTAIDNIVDYWPEGMFNPHWHVVDDDILHPRLKKQFQFISCISVLEHIKNHRSAVRSMFELLAPGGHLAMTFPFNETVYIENVYQLEGAGYGKDFPFIGQVFSRSQIAQWLQENPAELVAQEFWRVFSGSFWTFGERLSPPVQVTATELHQLTCVLFRKKG